MASMLQPLVVSGPMCHHMFATFPGVQVDCCYCFYPMSASALTLADFPGMQVDCFLPHDMLMCDLALQYFFLRKTKMTINLCIDIIDATAAAICFWGDGSLEQGRKQK